MKAYPKYESGYTSAELLERLRTTPGEEIAKIRDDLKIESLDEFEARMTRQFKTQLTSYRKRVIDVFNFGKNSQRLAHAQWTARIFTGETRSAIAAGIHRGYKNGDNSVSKAVTRCAKEIGLTLPE